MRRSYPHAIKKSCCILLRLFNYVFGTPPWAIKFHGAENVDVSCPFLTIICYYWANQSYFVITKNIIEINRWTSCEGGVSKCLLYSEKICSIFFFSSCNLQYSAQNTWQATETEQDINPNKKGTVLAESVSHCYFLKSFFIQAVVSHLTF